MTFPRFGVHRTGGRSTKPCRTQPQNSNTAAPPTPVDGEPVSLGALVGKVRERVTPTASAPPRRTRTTERYDALPPAAFTSREAMWTALREASSHGLLDSEPTSEADLLAWTTLAHFARRRSTNAAKAGGYLRRVLEQHEGSLRDAAVSVPTEFEDEAQHWLREHR